MSPAYPHRVRILGVDVDSLTMEQTIQRARELIDQGGVHHHAVVNAGKLVTAQKDADLLKALAQAAIVNADGQSVVWASFVLGDPLSERVAGIDFMERLLGEAALSGWPVYFLGAREEVVKEVVQREIDRHPGLVVAGFRNGYWDARDETQVVADIVHSKAQILLIAFSSPQKEHFVARHRDTFRDLFVVGVGGSFDVVAGRLERAPESWQRYGMEWAFRLKQEPRRMWRRYAIGNTQFVRLVYRQRRRQKLGRR